MEIYKNRVEKVAEYLRPHLEKTPDIGVILGSGLSGVVHKTEIIWEMPYADIPQFPQASAPGHKARLLLARVGDNTALFFQGRFHYYEGHAIQETVFPVKLLAHLGVKQVLLTNAAGGIQENIEVGSLVLIEDHMSFFLPSPLRGENDDALGPRFPDMSDIYSAGLRNLAQTKARELGISLGHGVYCYMPGPQYESPAEIRALRSLGADLVGMSTVAEAIVAKHAGMEVLGISTVTNLAAGLGESKLAHEDVLSIGEQVSAQASDLVEAIIRSL